MALHSPGSFPLRPRRLESSCGVATGGYLSYCRRQRLQRLDARESRTRCAWVLIAVLENEHIDLAELCGAKER